MRQLTKAEACRELAVSLSTLDRRIASGDIEVRREQHGRRHRVYVMLDDDPQENGVAVSYGFKVIKNYGLELTHRKAMASSTELLWRCLGRIAERWRRERDIRVERGGLFDPRDSQRVGYCPEHGAAIPEYAGGDATEAAAARRVEIGPVHGIHRQTDGGRVGELSSAAAGARGLEYEGSYTILAEYVRPRRRRRQPQATVRFETEPGEQAQVDWGSFSYVDEKGRKRQMWAFVMVLGWSRAIYVEFVRRADTASFIQCHVNAFEYFGGVPKRCLYDNAKVVTLGRDEEGRTQWNRRMLDFALRLGFELRLCQPYRAQTKGKVESGVKYVRGNLWPSLRFTDDADLNRQALQWCDSVANRRTHGTTGRPPAEMLTEEQPHLGKLPERSRLAPYLREDRLVARDGFVSWEGSRYGVHWKWVGATVQVSQRQGTVEIWAGRERLAVHPRAQQPGQRFTLPGQWEGLPKTDGRPAKEALAVQVPVGEVERRSLEVYELAAAGGAR